MRSSPLWRVLCLLFCLALGSRTYAAKPSVSACEGDVGWTVLAQCECSIPLEWEIVYAGFGYENCGGCAATVVWFVYDVTDPQNPKEVDTGGGFVKSYCGGSAVVGNILCYCTGDPWIQVSLECCGCP